MACLEYIGGQATAPSTTPTAITYEAGTSTIRNFGSQDQAFLLTAWARRSVAGYFRIRSPRLHDNVQGIRVQSDASAGSVSTCDPMLPIGFSQPLISQDSLTIELTGSAVGGAFENFGALIYYNNLPQANARLIGPTQLETRLKNIVALTFTITCATTAVLSTGVALSSATTGDLLKANTEYALLGATISNSATIKDVCAILVTGVDTGNLPVGMPGNNTNPEFSSKFFIELSKKTGLDLIPVINSANKGGTVVQVQNDANANTSTVSLIMAELA